MPDELHASIRQDFAARTYLMTLHAVRQAEERRITPRKIEEVMLGSAAEIIEDYPDDPRGPSCLVLGRTRTGRMLHVQVSRSPKVWVITVYVPSEEKWVDGKTRR